MIAKSVPAAKMMSYVRSVIKTARKNVSLEKHDHFPEIREAIARALKFKTKKVIAFPETKIETTTISSHSNPLRIGRFTFEFSEFHTEEKSGDLIAKTEVKLPELPEFELDHAIDRLAIHVGSKLERELEGIVKAIHIGAEKILSGQRRAILTIAVEEA